MSLYYLSNYILAYRTDCGMCGRLLPKHKRILRTPVMFRTDRDARELVHVVKRLKSFQRYSDGSHFQLARIIYYDCFLPGAVLLKQGSFKLQNHVIL